MLLIYNCYTPLWKHTVLEYGKSKPKTSCKSSIPAGTFFSRHSRKVKKHCWFLEIHRNFLSPGLKTDSFLILQLVSVVLSTCLTALYQGKLLILFMVLVTIFFFVFLVILCEPQPVLKPLLVWDFFSHFVTSALQGISLRKLLSFLGCCSDTGSNFFFC